MIIGLCGFINAGKGTAADYLVREHGFIKESFANSVKDSVSVIFGWDREMLEGATPESRLWREQADPWWSNHFNRPFTPRYAMQLMGTEAGRDVFDKNLWVYSTFRRMKPKQNYVIADVRFPNEIQKIKEEGGMILRVRKGNEPLWYMTALEDNLRGTYEMSKLHPDIHYSEYAWIGSEGIDYTITNDKTVQQFERIVKEMLPLCGIS